MGACNTSNNKKTNTTNNKIEVDENGNKLSEQEKIERTRNNNEKKKTEAMKLKNDEGNLSGEDDENDDIVDENFFENQITLQQKKPMERTSVSAEAFGKFNLKKDFIPRVIEKTDEQRNKILQKLNISFMFKNLDDQDKEIVIKAMEIKECKQDDEIIKQNEDGDVLQLIDCGEYDCQRRMKPDDTEDTQLKTYQPGEAFGELALLYNAPRAATIKCKQSGTLYQLDRDTFNNIVKEASVKRRNKYESFLSKVSILSTMDSYERSRLCDAIFEHKFNDGEQIIKEGDIGDDFYFLETGNCIATKNLDGENKEVKEYNEGDYFGELALIKGDPRAANIIAKGTVKVLSLERTAFKRILGPIETILSRNEDLYKKTMESLKK